MEEKQTVPPYKDTECRACKTIEVSLFARSPLRDNKDFYCRACMDAGKHTE